MIVLKILGWIWLASLALLAAVYLWCKFTGRPFVQDYDGEDF